MTSLPSLQVSSAVADGAEIALFIDLSTVGSAVAQQGSLAIMVSRTRAAFDTAKVLLDTLGRPVFVDEKPGAAQA